MELTPSLVTALQIVVTAIVTSVVSPILWSFVSRRQIKAQGALAEVGVRVEETDAIQQLSIKMIAPMEARIVALEADNVRLRQNYETLWMRMLQAQEENSKLRIALLAAQHQLEIEIDELKHAQKSSSVGDNAQQSH